MPIFTLTPTVRFTLFLCALATAWVGVGASYGLVLAYHFALALYLCAELFGTPIAATRAKVADLVRNPFVLFWVVSLAWFLLHIFIAEYPRACLMHGSKLLIGCSITVLLVANVRTGAQLSKIGRVLGGLLVLEIGVALGEMMGWWRYPISAFSHLNNYTNHPDIYDHIFVNNPNAVADIIAKVSTSPTGLHWNSNDMAVTILLLLPFVLLLRSNWWRNLILVTLVLITVWAGARLCMLSIILMWAVSWLYYQKGQWQTRFTLFFTLLFLFISGSQIIYQPDRRVCEMYQFLMGQNIDELANSDVTLARSRKITNTGSTRMALIRAGADIIQTHYGIGIGGDNFKARMEKIGGVGNSRVVNMHNFWLELVTEGGVLYGIFIAVCYFWLLRALYLRQKIIANPLLKITLQACFVSLVSFVLSSLSLASCIYFFPMYIILGISAAALQIED
jgi:teichuronic acid biosynthesis protein TuaE